MNIYMDAVVRYRYRLIAKAIRRLVESDTRVKRANARKMYKRALSALTRFVEQAYPPIDHDGKPIARGRMGCYCPRCKAAFKGWRNLLEHIRDRHDGVCFCGSRLPTGTEFIAGSIRHLKRHKSPATEMVFVNIKTDGRCGK